MARATLPFPGRAAAQRRPSLPARTPETEDATSLSRLALGWVAVGLLFAGALLSLYLVQVSSVANAGYDIERLEEERQTWLARNQQLEVELAKRHSLLWTEAEAVQRLGMTRSDPPKFLAVTATEAADPSQPENWGSAGRVASARPDRQIAFSPVDAVRPWLDNLLSRRP